jgi:CheY-like chemotaxis protein
MSAGSSPSSRSRILLVEDEMLVSMMLEDMLEDIGHEVAARAAALSEARSLAEEGTFDAAILDVHVGGEEIYPVADVLSSRGIPFIFSTGYGTGDLPESYRHHPALAKPFSRSDLERVLARVLRPAG